MGIEALMLLSVTATSLAGCLVAVRWLGLPARGLRVAAGRMLACLGLTFVFTCANLLVAGAVVAASRVLLGRFMSTYLLDDGVWIVLSLLQGLTLSFWQLGSGPRGR
jgi:hypothetical protein